MNQMLKQMLLVSVCMFALPGQAIAAPQSDAKLNYAMARHHNSDTTFFEWIENGVGGTQFVALKFNAEEEQDGTKWAECIYTVIYLNKETKRSELNMYHVSTNDKTINNLSVSPKSVSFDIGTGWFEPGGNTRQIKFLATRQGSSSYTYQANAVALWKSMFDEAKSIKIEWKQVPSITLPYPVVTSGLSNLSTK